MSNGLEVALVAGWLALLGTAITLFGNWIVAGGNAQRARRTIKEEIELLELLKDRPDSDERKQALERALEDNLGVYLWGQPHKPAQLKEAQLTPAQKRARTDDNWRIATVVIFPVVVVVTAAGFASQLNSTTATPLIHDLPTGLLAATVVATEGLLVWGLLKLLRHVRAKSSVT